MKDRAKSVLRRCLRIAEFSEETGKTTRRFLTPPVHEVHAYLRKEMEELGMSTGVDAAGNLRGLWRGEYASGKRLVIGSHIDSVPDAGAFDGVLGVVLALEWVLHARTKALPLSIEVIAFSEEEGVRYGVPFIGSRAVAGCFDTAMLAYVDGDGVRMDDAMRAFGLDSELLGDAAIDPNEVLGFIEMHIEQGPVLEMEDAALAVVEGIAGQSRLEFVFAGHANHAGTTPMHLRRDALAAAVEWMAVVEREARSTEGLVATVGKIAAEPDAANVIPGKVTLSLDVRHISDTERMKGVALLSGAAEQIAARREIELEIGEKMNQHSVHMDGALTGRLLRALGEAGLERKMMPSGAGHDAMVMAARVPATMLFLRSPGGISHHPDEAVLEEDVEAALKVGEKFLEQLAAEVE